MVNHMKWGGAGAESYLEVDVKLNLTLEVCLILIKYIHITYTVAFIFVSLFLDIRVVIMYVIVFKDYEVMNCLTSCKLYCSLKSKKSSGIQLNFIVKVKFLVCFFSKNL